MSFKIITSDYFNAEAKKLAKIHSKGRGKSGGARVITFNALISESDGIIALLLIYDKADTSNIKKNIVAEIIKSLGL